MDTQITLDLESIARHLAGCMRLRKQDFISHEELKAIRFSVSELVGEEMFNKAMEMAQTMTKA